MKAGQVGRTIWISYLRGFAAVYVVRIRRDGEGEERTLQGPNTFRSALIDECYNLSAEDVLKCAKVRRV
jgi:thiamine-phosphate diphosphorylase/hydroxyethylthiazole kinase